MKESQIHIIDKLADEIREQILIGKADDKMLKKINQRVNEVISELDFKKYFKRLG